MAFAVSASAVEIVSETELVNAQSAVRLLSEELKGLPGGEEARIVLRHDAKLKDEEFILAGDSGTVTVTAGKYGFVPATAYYLDKLCGIIFMTPFEKETANAKVATRFAEVRRLPAFDLRDLYFTTGMDGGRFSALRGMNSHGDYTAEFCRNNGMLNRYGGPKFCHTFHLYYPTEKYFDAHPEWYSEIDGKRYRGAPRRTQLCMSNKELRKAFAAKLLATIAEDRRKAAELHVDPPYVYDVSQNDCHFFCTCAECTRLKEQYGGRYSGLLLDFVNEIAADVTAVHPEIKITTFAYFETELPPSGIKPHPNVIIVLCDTISNTVKPIRDPENSLFAGKVRDWSKIATGLRIWDYDVNYERPTNELPYDNEDVFQDDLRFFREHRATQFFVEFEFPVTSDARDYKLYLLTELIADPDADVAAAKKRFTDAYYGAAGSLFLRYRELLRQSQARHNTFLSWSATKTLYTHLDYATVNEAQRLFDEGERLLADDAARLR
ncbi:MAG: DUF4838 domain-containing protein, partial [Victivallales bacterium]|nr:DUF4838 domain-containing protein [Victivallales bacterium]